MVTNILDSYAKCYKEVLCIPCTQGTKSESERFPGAEYTTCVESYVSESGRSIQAGTSHYLAQIFAKMFKIEFENKQNKKEHVYQTSWGVSTRSIGAFVMIHGDDKGMVMTPRCAIYQVVIVPIYIKKQYEDMNNKSHELAKYLKKNGIRAHVDDRDNYTPGFRYNYWEIRGIPIRLELGPKDMENEQFMACRRVDGKKIAMKWEGLLETLKAEFIDISDLMYNKAKDTQDSKKKTVLTWKDFMENINKKMMCLAPWCDTVKCEEDVNERSRTESLGLNEEDEQALTGKAKTLCIPFEQPELADNQTCFACENKAKLWALWGRSY